MNEPGPRLPFADELHATKYRGEGESFREAMGRVAHALCDPDSVHPGHYHEFRDILMDMRFMPGGRIQAAMGSTRQTTPYNCFVSGTLEDSFVAGHGSIMERAKEAATTMRLGGGIGYDFSTLRPRGALIKKLQSRSSGAVSFMRIFDAVGACVASAGHRRGAQMGVLRVDHPDIEEFIRAKQNTDNLTGFNVSIAVTDEFMRAVATQSPFMLRWNGDDYGEVDAAELWESIMRSTWDWAEPGVLFIDAINRGNNLWYCETIAATNPCAEQPLPPYGACLLGSFNLVKYLSRQGMTLVAGRSELTPGYTFDFDRLVADIPVVVRAMDNVVDRATYPLHEQEMEARNKRRMGLGITGLANAAEAQGLVYGSPGFIEFQRRVLETIRDACYAASAELAREKGAFRLFDAEKYLAGSFMQSLPEHVRDLIQRNGIRNSHITSIAPTGTISLCADNVSSGIEPVFSHSFERTVVEFNGTRKELIEDYGVAHLGVRGRVASEVTVQEHISVLLACVESVDSAVSKTCNVPENTPWEEFKGLYRQVWEGGGKGCTTFQTGGKRAGILVASKSEEPEDLPEKACYIDPESGRRECG